MRRGLLAAGAVAAAAVAGCGDSDGSGGDAGARTPAQTTTTRVEVIRQAGRGAAFDPQALYEREAPGVVTVYSLFGDTGGLGDVLGGGGGGGGVGSGFVIDGKGDIATNAHVVTQGEGSQIRRAREVYVEFADGNRVAAKVVGHDPFADIALLKVDPKGLTLRPLALGTDGSVEVGEPVAAIGSPFGERQSLSVGVVSARDRSVQSLTNFQISGAVQTDAAINPGNSGGPLVDGDGRVIGVNQQIRTSSGANEGVGYAVPIDLVKRALAALERGGEVDYAYLGVSTQALYPQLVDRFDLPVEKGAWVQEVSAGGPADDAGLRGGGRTVRFQGARVNAGGDIIVRVGDSKVEDPDDLADAIAKLRPRQTVEVELRRGKETKTVRVKLAERPVQGPDSTP